MNPTRMTAMRRNTMQYALLIHQGTTPLPDTAAWSELPPDEQTAIYADYAALNRDERVTPGLPLGLPSAACTVRVENGSTVTTAGSYHDDPVGGMMLVDVDDLDAAIEIASRIPAARLGGTIEVRPVEKYW
jgi:hypothetical protein